MIRRKFFENEAAISGPILKILIIIVFLLVVVGIASFISLVWGLFAFIGICLLVGAAFVLFMKKGKVTFKPNSAFMWLLILGIVLVVISPVVGQLFGNPTIDFSVIPGTRLISMNLLGSTCVSC